MYPPTLQFVITISIDHREAQPGTRPFQLKNFHNHHSHVQETLTRCNNNNYTEMQPGTRPFQLMMINNP